MGLHSYMVVYIIFWLLVIYFNYRQIKFAQTLPEKKERNLIFWLQPILFIGVLLRTVYLTYPYGVYCDEAMNGYDSWCLANYGVDHFLISNPVYLKSWGEGMSALYAYIAIPFIQILGFSKEVFRMPMALIGCCSMLYFYYTLRKTKVNTFLLFVIITFWVINPWHIMKSRFALDCNICPDIILIGLCCIILATIKQNKKAQSLSYILGSGLLALSSYSYGVSWLVLPFLCVGLFAYLLKKKLITSIQLCFCIITIGVLIIPIALYAVNLFFDGAECTFGPFTIISMESKRYEVTTLFGSDNLSGDISNYIHDTGRLFIIGADGMIQNTIRYWGQYYNPVSIFFFLFYIAYLIRKRQFSIFDAVFSIWLLSTAGMLLLVHPNANHWHLLWFPMIYFCAGGIYTTLHLVKKSVYIIAPLFLLMFSCFIYEYFDYYRPENKDILWKHPGFTPGLEEAVKFVNEKQFEKIFYSGTSFSTSTSDAPVILFLHPMDPHLITFFERYYMEKCGNHYYYLPENISPQQKTAYVISKDKLDDINTTDYNVEEFQWYVVLWND